MNEDADLKPLLIDLEVNNDTTGGKQVKTVQPERLNRGDNMYTLYWIHLKEHFYNKVQGYIGITNNLKKRLVSHKANKKISHFTNAIKKYKFDNLIIDIIQDNLTLEEALKLENILRPVQNLGWNSQIGGNLGVESSWYTVPENKTKHSIATSNATKLGISLKDTKELRSERAKNNWKTSKNYTDSKKGSKNGRAFLNELQVKCIKMYFIIK